MVCLLFFVVGVPIIFSFFKVRRKLAHLYKKEAVLLAQLDSISDSCAEKGCQASCECVRDVAAALGYLSGELDDILVEEYFTMQAMEKEDFRRAGAPGAGEPDEGDKRKRFSGVSLILGKVSILASSYLRSWTSSAWRLRSWWLVRPLLLIRSLIINFGLS